MKRSALFIAGLLAFLGAHVVPANANGVIVFAMSHWVDSTGAHRAIAESAKAPTEEQASYIAVAWCKKHSGGHGVCHVVDALTTTEGAMYLVVGRNRRTNEVMSAFGFDPEWVLTICERDGFECTLPKGGSVDD